MPSAASGRVGLLAQTAQTIGQMADIARASYTDIDNQSFFCHLASICLQIQCCIGRLGERQNETRSELIEHTLGNLSCLLSDAYPVEGLSTNFPSSSTRLDIVNSSWSDVGQHNTEAKRAFVAQWLRPGTECDGLEKTLQQCADAFEIQRSSPANEPSFKPIKRLNVSKPPYDIHKAARSTFEALLRSSQCACPGRHDFSAKLELGSYRRSRKDQRKRSVLQSRARAAMYEAAAGDVDLGMYLSMDQDWQAVRIQTEKDRMVSFTVEEEPSLPSHPNITRKGPKRDPKKVDSLCKPIGVKGKLRQRLVLKLSKGTLFDMGFEESKFQIDTQVEPVSLSKCLEQGHGLFSERTKRTLSLLLGFAVIHLQGTPWLQPEWGSDNIQFFQTTTSKTPLRPFIQTRLPKNSKTETTTDIGLIVHNDQADPDGHDIWDAVGQQHCCPALISLAAVLLEVHFATPFKQLSDDYGVDLVGDPAGPISPFDVVQLFYGDEESDIAQGARKDMPQGSPLVQAIENCLESSWWEDDKGNPLDNMELRTRMYEKVISLLECDLSYAFQDVPLESIDQYAQTLYLKNSGHERSDRRDCSQITMTASTTATSTNPSSSSAPLLFGSQHACSDFISFGSNTAMFQAQGHPLMPNIVTHATAELNLLSLSDFDYSTTRFYDDEADNRDTTMVETKKYRIWKSEYKKVYESFTPRTITNRVKIAILDTGVCRDHTQLAGYEDNFKDKRNFYDASKKSNVVDRHGHGTFTTHLLLEYAPDAEIYIIKITGKDNISPEGDVVAKAIRFAADEWGVDIISMSFGWPSGDFDGFQDVQSAIDYAYDKKVLMFAAASNSGGRLGRAYPSSSSEVICVHSTNTNGSRSDFSPTAEPNAINIATVGQSVEAAWLESHFTSTEDDDAEFVLSRSGTSYATPIMAGIAAFLLQYARTHLSESEALELKRKSTMEALLKRCAQRGPNYKPRDGYFYVELSLHKHNLFGQGLEWATHEIRNALRK